jgi:hypothetical protein
MPLVFLLQDHCGFFKFEPRISRAQFACIALTQVAQEVDLP